MNADVANIVARAEIIPRTPPCGSPDDGGDIPDDIIGAKILRLGTIAWDLLCELCWPIEGAGLVIDYLPIGSDTPRRASFGASELGVWLAYQGEVLTDKEPDPSQDRDRQ